MVTHAQTPARTIACPAAPFGNPLSEPMWNGWGADPTNTRFQPVAAAGLTAADVPKLALKWAVGFPEGQFAASQPTVVGGRIYLGFGGSPGVTSIDAASGCAYWTFRAQDTVRTAVTIGRVTLADGPRYLAFFGDLQGNVYAIDAETGMHLWSKRVDVHPSARIMGAPTFHEGRLYVPVSSLEEALAGRSTYACCTFRGNVVSLDAATGQEIWRTYTIDEKPVATKKRSDGVQMYGPAGGAVWNAPTIDAIGQKVGIGWGLDPDHKGAILWQHQVGIGSTRGGILFGSAADERQVFFATSDVPHGPDRAGGLAAVNLATGTRAWYVRPPAMKCAGPKDQRCIQGQSAAVTAIPGVVFSGATNGIMRAYAASDGKVLWEYDTVRDFETINKLPAKGGYIDGPGPVVVNGVVYFNSGYSTLRGGVPGNVLLAFSAN